MSGTSREQAFAVDDLVLKDEHVMTVTRVDPAGRRLDCLWYEVDRRCSGNFSFDEVRLLVASAVRHAARPTGGGAQGS